MLKYPNMSGEAEKITPRPNKPISEMSPDERTVWVNTLRKAVQEERYGVSPTSLARAVLNWAPGEDGPDQRGPRPRPRLFDRRAYMKEWMRQKRALAKQASAGNRP